MPPKILVITGPTASGKTALAVELALRRGGEVVSADSMQVYRRMDIGTAKPTREEMRGVPHHMLDVADPEENFSVARYVEMAGACVDDILSRGRLPIVAGGTGLYVDSLLSGRTFAAFSDADVGLDAEWRGRPIPLAVLRRLSEAEREEDFFRLWTAKEAFVKYLGGSLATLLPALRFERGVLLHNNAPVNATLAFYEQAGCTIAVCTAQAQPVLFHEISD